MTARISLLVALCTCTVACSRTQSWVDDRAKRADAAEARDAGAPTSDAAVLEDAASDGGAFDSSSRDASTRDSAGPCAETEDEATSEDCVDLIDDDATERATITSGENEQTSLTAIRTPQGIALRMETVSRFAVRMRYELPEEARNASEKDELRFRVRSEIDTAWWGGSSPTIVIIDARGRRRALTPSRSLLWDDGVRWQTVRAPLRPAPGWTISGDPIDLADLRAVEIAASPNAPFTMDIDTLRFARAGSACDRCSDCNGRGRYARVDRTCICEAAYAGESCETCAPSFVRRGSRCILPDDETYDFWPNPVSHTNSDAWLPLHHDDIRVLRPKLLVLNFVNAMEPAEAGAFVDDTIRAIREASKPRGYENPSTEPQLEYDVVKIVDLRDGVDGRPDPPPAYPYENSTLFPRVTRGASLQFDYRPFYDRDFGELYALEDEEGEEVFDLCDAVERGVINELWFIGVDRGDDADAVPAEVLEHKQVYDLGGQRLPNVMTRCAGNGCFEESVPVCGRSLRIMVLYYDYHPGLTLHLFGHGLESQASALALSSAPHTLPALSEWFFPFGGFDLDRRYSLPFHSLYVSCDGTCVQYPDEGSATFRWGADRIDVDPYAAACGNVHFPPNARFDYDYYNEVGVLSSCTSFGRSERTLAPISAADWSMYSKWMPSNGGDYLIWWFQNMPAYGSGHHFDDGRTMPSVWPFLFY